MPDSDHRLRDVSQALLRHYFNSENWNSIDEHGLQPGADGKVWSTPDPSLSAEEAPTKLALDHSVDAVARIDLDVVRASNSTVSEITPVVALEGGVETGGEELSIAPEVIPIAITLMMLP